MEVPITHVALNYLVSQNASVNLPVDTYLKDSVVADYGGILASVETLDISLGGAFRSYPPADHSPVIYDFFNTISILDGGVFEFFGTAADGDLLNIQLNGSLMIRGGGEMIVNNLELYGIYTISFLSGPRVFYNCYFTTASNPVISNIVYIRYRTSSAFCIPFMYFQTLLYCLSRFLCSVSCCH